MKKLKIRLEKLQKEKLKCENKYQQLLKEVKTDNLDPMQEIEKEENLRVSAGLTGIESKIMLVKKKMVNKLFDEIDSHPSIIKLLGGEDNIKTLKQGKHRLKYFNKLLKIAKKLN